MGAGRAVQVRLGQGGSDLITKYQAIYGLGVLISDSVIITDGVLICDAKLLSSGVLISDNIMVSNGITMGDGMVFMNCGLLISDGVINK